MKQMTVYEICDELPRGRFNTSRITEDRASQPTWFRFVMLGVRMAEARANSAFGRAVDVEAADDTSHIRDGWKLVPIEPTEEMVIDGFESEPSALFSSPEAWDEYEQMSGCRQAAHRARLCYAAMLNAAPSPSVASKGEPES